MTSQLRTQISNGLHWVREELDKSLDRARHQIEHHVENPEDSVTLQKALVEIHTIRGTAMLIQCFGVAILAEEMKQVVLVLLLRRIKEPEAAFSALLGAAVQLSDYISGLAMGEEDCALVLQPLINELRLSRSKPILTEPELFALHINTLGLMLPMTAPANPGAQDEARKLLPHFQKALLSWLKNEPDARLSLGRIGKIAEQIAERCTEISLHQLWRVVATTVEAMLADELDQIQDLKRLVGAVGQQIKLLADNGEAAALDKLGDLPSMLMFFIGRSQARGARASVLRKTYQFDSYLPSAAKIDERRQSMRGPGATLLVHVADEIRKDLIHVKDHIDLVVRSGSNAAADLTEIRARLHRVAATLSALGLAPLQRVLENQIKLLESLGNGSEAAAVWMNVATSILRVELGLEDALFRQVSHPGAGLELHMEMPHRHDLADSVTALLRESLVNLSRLKSSCDRYLRDGDVAQITESARLLKEISSGLRILQNERAASLVDDLEQYIRSPRFAQVRETREQAERFADAIASIEYYIEAARDQLPEAEPILDGLSRYVGQLHEGQIASAKTEEDQPASMMTPQPAVAENIDPEIRDIFLEEAGDVLSTLQDSMPALRLNGQDRSALDIVRRAFHTLKGSGRMVGAQQIGEFALAVENLLNRCLDGALTVDALILDAVDDAVRLLPQLIARFREGSLFEDSALQAVISHANSLAFGHAVEMAREPDITTVFREDAREKLAVVDQWLSAQDPQAATYKVDEAVLRSFHTLRGSGHVANMPAISELAETLETYLTSMRVAEMRLPPAALQLLAEATQTLKQWVESAPGTKCNTSPWMDRVQQLQAEVPQDAQHKTEERQLAEIFSVEAFELLQKIESSLNAWAHAPDFRQAADDIRDFSHTLLGAALMSQCQAVANPARQLNRCMAHLAAQSKQPTPEFFEQMTARLEEFFQILDAYREGRLDHDGSALAQRISSLDAQTHKPQILAASASSAPTAIATNASTDGPVEEVIEMTLVEESEELDQSPSAHALSAGDDLELTQIFISEAEELLQNFDGSCATWEANPSNIEPAREIKRLLHTLKGSARVAGFGGIGDFAERLEQMMAALGESLPDRLLLARLHQASDGLHRVLNDMQQGRLPDVSSLLSDLDASPQLQPEPVTEPVVLIEETPTVVAARVPEAASAQESAPAIAVTPTDVDEDFELVRIFSAEATELLENMQQSYGAWQREPRDLTGAREMQRALHTLKGGARMAGLHAMGNAAHEMETRINALEMAGGVNATALEPLSVILENLNHMHDLLERGDYASLQRDEVVPADQPAMRAAAEATPVHMPVADQVVDGSALWEPQLFWRPEDDAANLVALRRETARVPVENLDTMLNQAGEISIYRSRLEEHNNAIQLQLNEMTQAIARVRDQLRLMDIETDAQISARGMGQTGPHDRYAGDFDPLEMDRYTRMQELSRSLAESVGDLSALNGAMDGLAGEAETLLQQQGRINTQVQQSLMRTLMVPFSRQVARLQRVVKQTAQENDKQADAFFSGIESELDRNVLERMTAPLEHLLRNSVVHGLEDAQGRAAAGKPPMGMVRVSLRREGTQLLIELSDDGKGLDHNAIRATAIKRGLMSADVTISDEETAQFIFEPGFSTAKKLTHDAGRGIGMDVVASEVKQLGGTLELASEAGKGTRFLIRLPLNLAISQALLVEVGHDLFAIPLASIEGIVRIPREQLDDLYREEGVLLPYGGHDYRVHHLGDFIGLPRHLDGETKTVSAILVRLGEGLGSHERRVAVVVDALHDNREIVSKAVGPLVSSVTGVSGATILADGRVVLILDIPALALERSRRTALSVGKQHADKDSADTQNLIMVVDDSVTIRRVTERLLVKQGYRVMTAKDGLDAMAKLQTEHPTAVLLDIEMPRADGFEVATFIRNNERLRHVPIIMITSRSGDKHRDRAMQIGVNRYLIKPFQEDDLVRNLRAVMAEVKA